MIGGMNQPAEWRQVHPVIQAEVEWTYKALVRAGLEDDATFGDHYRQNLYVWEALPENQRLAMANALIGARSWRARALIEAVKENMGFREP